MTAIALGLYPSFCRPCPVRARPAVRGYDVRMVLEADTPGDYAEDVERDDASLVQGCLAGDQEAYRILVDRYRDRAYWAAYHVVHHHEDAADIAQEAFIRVWRSAARYQPQAQFTTWLYRIVVNLCLDFRRRRRHASIDAAGADAPAGEEPSAELEREELSRTIQRVVADLPDRQRVALVLHRFSGLSLAEVCSVTGLSDSAVESLLVRAYAALRKKLEYLVRK